MWRLIKRESQRNQQRVIPFVECVIDLSRQKQDWEVCVNRAQRLNLLKQDCYILAVSLYILRHDSILSDVSAKCLGCVMSPTSIEMAVFWLEPAFSKIS